MVQAISDFQNQQTGYDAALKAYSMVQRLSLFQYLNPDEPEARPLDARQAATVDCLRAVGSDAIHPRPGGARLLAVHRRKRTVIATRLTRVPAARRRALDVAPAAARGRRGLARERRRASRSTCVSESLLQDLLSAAPSANLMVEVPASWRSTLPTARRCSALHARGSTLLLKGRPLRELPREVLPCFKYSIIDLADERRVGEAAPRRPA